MKHRRTRNPFRHAASRRFVPVAVLSATLFAAATGGSILLNQGVTAGPAHDTTNAAVVDLALADGDDRGERGERADRSDRGEDKSDRGDAKSEEKPKPPSQRVLGYDFQEQPNFYYCGPAATRIALTARGVKLSQDELATKLNTDMGGTDSANDVTRVLNDATGKNVYKTREIRGAATPADMDRLQADVVNAISNDHAVVANVVGGVTTTEGVWRGYPGGHYVAIIGYSDDGRKVKVADPAGIGGDGTYWVTTINMATWMSSRGYSA